MRNIDKIKGLQNQNEEAKKQILKLRAENKYLQQASKEIQAAVDALMIALAKQYGEHKDLKTWVLCFPKPDVKDVNDFTIAADTQGEYRYIYITLKEVKNVERKDSAN